MAIVVKLRESRLFRCPLTYMKDQPDQCHAEGVGDTCNCLWWCWADHAASTGYCGAGGDANKKIVEPPR